MTQEWYQILEQLQITSSLPRRILLVGPPGTGKSRWAEALGSHQRITLHGSVDPSDLLGTWTLQGMMGSTQTVFQPGPAARALQENMPLVLDEIDQAGPEVTCLLYALLDDPAAVTLPTGDRVSAQAVQGDKGYRVIATTNASPSSLPAALLDRFDLVLTCWVPAPAALDGLPVEYLEACTRSYARQRQEATSYNWCRPVSLRSLRAICALADTLGVSAAAELVVGSNGTDLATSLAVISTGA
jgi:hypothetical protein